MNKNESKSVRVVAALLREGEKFLIFRRPPHKARGGLWEFVGGKVEVGENDSEALARECKEEIGVEVEVGDLFFETLHAYPDITVNLVLYVASILGNKPPLLLEHMEYSAITPLEIEHFDFCPADIEILHKITDSYQKGEW